MHLRYILTKIKCLNLGTHTLKYKYVLYFYVNIVLQDVCISDVINIVNIIGMWIICLYCKAYELRWMGYLHFMTYFLSYVNCENDILLTNFFIHNLMNFFEAQSVGCGLELCTIFCFYPCGLIL